MKRYWGALVVWFATCLAAAEGPPAAPAGRKMQMTEAITAADFQQIEGGPLVIAAYAVVWVVFFGALVFLFFRMRRVNAELQKLQRDLQRTEGTRS
jgi:CcmD family protein